MKTHMKYLLPALAVSSLIGGAKADTITFGGNDWVGDVTQYRTFIGGGGSTGWAIFDNGSTSGGPTESRQQWTWMDVSDALAEIPAGHTVISATLTYDPGPTENQNNGSSVNYAIFEVPDANRGRDSVIAAGGAGRDGNDVMDFYAENTGYGEGNGVTGTAEVFTFDITDLVEGWNNGTLTTNPGQMMLLWDSLGGSNNFVNWVPDATESIGGAAQRPVLTIETQIPEPGSLALLGLGGLCLLRRRRS